MSRGYYVSTVGLNQKAVEEYIRNQEKEDMMYDQISFKEFDELFKKVKQGLRLSDPFMCLKTPQSKRPL